MRSLAGGFGVLASGALLAAACSGSAGRLFSNDAGANGVAGLGGFSGRGGRGGTSAGRGGTGGEAGLGGTSSGGMDDAGIPMVDAGDECADDSACDDGNDCTADVCDGSGCSNPPLASGAECGSTNGDACDAPDSCDGDGVCRANEAADGSACEGGSCTSGECIQGQPEGCPAQVVTAVPFETSWRTVGGFNVHDASCDRDDTPDFAVVFTAPSDATYRFEAAGVVGTDDPESQDDDDASEEADSVLALVAGACPGVGAAELTNPLACNDDVPGGATRDSRIDRALTAGETVTVYAGEFREVLPGGGSGTLRISVLDD
jgi:hypothetical protein